MAEPLSPTTTTTTAARTAGAGTMASPTSLSSSDAPLTPHEEALVRTIVESVSDNVISNPEIVGYPASQTVLDRARQRVRESRLETESLLRPRGHSRSGSATGGTSGGGGAGGAGRRQSFASVASGTSSLSGSHTHISSHQPTSLNRQREEEQARKAKEDERDRVAPDRATVEAVDAWLADGRHVRAEIESSKADAAEIADRARTVAHLRQIRAEVDQKAGFIRAELAFVKTVEAAFEMVRSMGASVVDVDEKLRQIEVGGGDVDVGSALVQVVGKVVTLSSELQGLGPLGTAKFASLLARQGAEARARVVECVRVCWDVLFTRKFGPVADEWGESGGPGQRGHHDDDDGHGDEDEGVVYDEGARALRARLAKVPPDVAVRVAKELSLFDDLLSILSTTFTNRVIFPVFGSSTFSPRYRPSFPTVSSPSPAPPSAASASAASAGKIITIDTATGPGSPAESIEDFKTIVGLVRSSFPKAVATRLVRDAIGGISAELVRNSLTPAVPTELAAYPAFEALVDDVGALIEHVDRVEHEFLGGASSSSSSASASSVLKKWRDTVHVTWLASRKAVALDRARLAYWDNVDVREIVLGEVGRDEEMDGEVGDEEREREREKGSMDRKGPASGIKDRVGAGVPEEDEDVDETEAWGFDDDDNEDEAGHEAGESSKPEVAASPLSNRRPGGKERGKPTDEGDEEEEEEDAWGWNEDVDVDPAEGPGRSSPSPSLPPHDGKAGRDQDRPRYLITGVPRAILEIVKDAIRDAIELGQEESPYSLLTPTAPGLCSIPTLVVAVYRATAMAHYALVPAGRMLLHNDCVWLASQLGELNRSSGGGSGSNSDDDGGGGISAASTFYSVDSSITTSAEAEAEPSRPGPTPLAAGAHLPPHSHSRPLPVPVPDPIRLRLRLDQDVDAVVAFGREAYLSELADQQAGLAYVLAGLGQSVESFAVPRERDECFRTVEMAVGVVRDVVSGPWRAVLAPEGPVGIVGGDGGGGEGDGTATAADGRFGPATTAQLAHAAGQLYATVVDAVVSGIVALADISADESEGLERLCARVRDASGAVLATVDLGRYTPGWARLEYLIAILAGSLSSIRAMWVAEDGAGGEGSVGDGDERARIRRIGPLSDAFSAKEVVHLVNALFAVSDKRRATIDEVWRVDGERKRRARREAEWGGGGGGD